MTIHAAAIDEAVEQLITTFAKTAATRDKQGGTAYAERQLLRQSGLLYLCQDGDIPWQTILRITRQLAAVDSSLAHLFGYHYLCIATIELYGTRAHYEQALTQGTQHQHFYGNAFNPLDTHVTATKQADGQWLLQGTKYFCSGASDADCLLVSAQKNDGSGLLMAVIPANRTGVHIHNDWDSFGQRQTDSGAVTFNDVAILPHECLALHTEEQHYFSTCRTHIAQTILLHVLLGTAEWAFQEAKSYTKTSARPWVTAHVNDATEDPYTLQHYGTFFAKLQAADALLERAVQTLVTTLHKKHHVTEEDRGICSIAIATAKVHVVETTLHITSTMFQVMGARATSAQYNFDRFWRNVRTHTLHDPIDYKLRDLGHYALNDRYPTISSYS